MTQVSPAEIPQALEPAFAAGDPAARARARERAVVEQIGRRMHRISRGRWDELRELAPDVTCERVAPARVPWHRRAHGADEVAATIAGSFAAACGQRTEPLSLVSQGDTMMVMAREAGRCVDGGRPYEVMMAQRFTVGGDGRLAGFRSIVGEARRPGRFRRSRR